MGENYEVELDITATKPLSLQERYGLQEREGRHILVRVWADILRRRIGRQEVQLRNLRGVHRSYLVSQSSKWNPVQRDVGCATIAMPRGVRCWRTSRGALKASVFTAQRSRIDWRVVQREVATRSWLRESAVITAKKSQQMATMPRGIVSKLGSCGDIRRQVESIIRHAKDDPWCDEAMELNRSLSKVYSLEAEVRRLDEQLLIACHALEVHFNQRPDPIAEAMGASGIGKETSSTNGSYTRYREINQSTLGRSYDEQTAEGGAESDPPRNDHYYRQHAHAIERRRRSQGPLFAPRRMNNKRAIYKLPDPVFDDDGEEVFLLDMESYNQYRNSGTASSEVPQQFEEAGRPAWQHPVGSRTDKSNRSGGEAVRPIEQTPSPVEPHLGSRGSTMGESAKEARIQRMARLERIRQRHDAAYEAEAAGAVASSWDCDILARPPPLPDHLKDLARRVHRPVVFGANEGAFRIIIQD